MARSDPQVNFRIPADLNDRLKAAAAENRRTITAELVHRLQESFTSISADDIVAKAENSDVVELIALQKMMADMYMSQHAYLTTKIFDLLDKNGQLDKYKSEESDSWLKLSPPAPGQEFTDAQFSLEIARTKKD